MRDQAAEGQVGRQLITDHTLSRRLCRPKIEKGFYKQPSIISTFCGKNQGRDLVIVLK